MNPIAETPGQWLGLCPKAPVFRASETGSGYPAEPAHEGRPDGGAGGPDTIRRGIGSALSGTRTLIHNPRLLWFSLFTGLVLAAHLIAQMFNLFQFLSEWLVFFNLPYAGILSLLIQTFAIEFLTVFCLVFLLAGLMLSLSSRKGGTVSFFQGLKQATDYLEPLTGWSVVMALAGTLIYTTGMYTYEPTWSSPFNIISTLYFKLGYFLFDMRYQFPFNIVLVPTFYIPNLPPVFGGEGWLISWAIENTVILSAITVFLFVLTLFVVPLLVLEKKSLKEAVVGSFTLMKKIRVEAGACILGLGTAGLAAWFAFLLFRFSFADLVSWVAGPMYVSFTHHSDAWIAAGLLYVLVLFSVVFIVATVGGIAALDLYRYAKIRADTRIR